MIRILHVLGGLNSGGAETMIMNYYRNIDREKIQFDFIIHKETPQFYENEIKEMGGKIYKMPRYKIYNHFTYKKMWTNFIKEHKEYKIIHGHMRSTASIYLKIAKKNDRITICHSHSTSNGKNITAFIKNIFQLNIKKVSDYFMGCSYEANKWLFGNKIANSDKCQIINNGININKFLYNAEIREKIRTKLKIGKSDILIGHVGRFEKVKNHNFIIKLFEDLYKKNNNYKLLLIGAGPLKKKIQKKYKNHNFMNNVIILDPQKNINEYIQAMDIFILPSKYEGLGIVLIEAQISGIQCIASSKIPKNVKITPNIAFLKLKTYIWENKIKQLKDDKLNSRNFNKITPKIKKFDIKENSKLLTNFYFNVLEVKK